MPLSFLAFNFVKGHMVEVDLNALSDQEAAEILPQDETTQQDFKRGRANGAPLLEVLSRAQSGYNERSGIKTR